MLNLLSGGWEYNWLGILQSGTPMTLPGNFKMIGDPRISGANHNQYFNTCEVLANGTPGCRTRRIPV